VGYLEFVNGRLDCARELLALREWKIKRIGAAVGYQTAPYFTRFFRRLAGMSPQEYRHALARKVDGR
jgi:two-component system response regulator YesN